MSAVAKARAVRSTKPLRRAREWATLSLRAGFVAYVAVLVVLPLVTLVVRGFAGGVGGLWEEVTSPIAVDAVLLSLGTSFVAALVNGVMGFAIAWVLVRWEIPGRRALSALVDLPFAIPTLVAGILLVALYGPQTPIGGFLTEHGVKIVFAKPGIMLALLFVTLPFVVRAVEPVIRELDPAEEEAALTMGARPWTTFVRILLPPLLPAIASGTVQVFARSVAEFGSIAAVSGNIPHRTLTAPVHILGEVERGETSSAAAVSIVLLALALALQLVARRLVKWAGGHRG